MEYYPGTLINACDIDYRKKITAKGEAMEKKGSIYLQKCQEIYNFIAVAFLRVDDTDIKGSLQTGIKEMLKILKNTTSPVI